MGQRAKEKNKGVNLRGNWYRWCDLHGPILNTETLAVIEDGGSNLSHSNIRICRKCTEECNIPAAMLENLTYQQSILSWISSLDWDRVIHNHKPIL